MYVYKRVQFIFKGVQVCARSSIYMQENSVCENVCSNHIQKSLIMCTKVQFIPTSLIVCAEVQFTCKRV